MSTQVCTQPETVEMTMIAEAYRGHLACPPALEAWLGSPLLPGQRGEVKAIRLERKEVIFQLMRPLSVGSQEVLEISLGDQRLAMRVQVKRCRPAERGAWEIRAAFC